MSIRYRVLKEHGLVCTQMTARVTDADLIAHGRDMATDPEIIWPLRQLVDVRTMDPGSPITAGGLRTLAEVKFGEIGHVGRIGVVVDSDLEFGLARLFEAYAESLGGEVLVARTVGEACSFLSVEDLTESVDRDHEMTS